MPESISTPAIRLGELSDSQRQFWEKANRDVLWGWKRDVEDQSRLVYFSGEIGLTDSTVRLERRYFYYRSVLRSDSAEDLVATAEKCRETMLSRDEAGVTLNLSRKGGRTRIEFFFGTPSVADTDRVSRLRLRRPRRRIVEPEFPSPSDPAAHPEVFPCDLYVGSGISYEAGLPTLCDMHDAFAVDNEEGTGFMVGEKDWLLSDLGARPNYRLSQFCAVHSGALSAEPTHAMRRIARLQQAGVVGNVFTDNVDNLLCKVGASYERVRGSGVFNEKCDPTFTRPNLIVIGVAADRRQLIRQARAERKRIVVVNPCKKVSPNVTHLDYLRGHDLFFKTDADTFFRHASTLNPETGP
ncbi:MAG: hypothetical protein AAGC68_05515 [Verrucomicrobiota bacterium]